MRSARTSAPVPMSASKAPSPRMIQGVFDGAGGADICGVDIALGGLGAGSGTGSGVGSDGTARIAPVITRPRATIFSALAISLALWKR